MMLKTPKSPHPTCMAPALRESLEFRFLGPRIPAGPTVHPLTAFSQAFHHTATKATDYVPSHILIATATRSSSLARCISRTHAPINKRAVYVSDGFRRRLEPSFEAIKQTRVSVFVVLSSPPRMLPAYSGWTRVFALLGFLWSAADPLSTTIVHLLLRTRLRCRF